MSEIILIRRVEGQGIERYEAPCFPRLYRALRSAPLQPLDRQISSPPPELSNISRQIGASFYADKLSSMAPGTRDEEFLDGAERVARDSAGSSKELLYSAPLAPASRRLRFAREYRAGIKAKHGRSVRATLWEIKLGLMTAAASGEDIFAKLIKTDSVARR
ncbi:hypothetical protein KM043_003943 [Ampulex compressa]|nr:hypothetical protein KM043_003943 [Ampulex compressa]